MNLGFQMLCKWIMNSASGAVIDIQEVLDPLLSLHLVKESYQFLYLLGNHGEMVL